MTWHSHLPILAVLVACGTGNSAAPSAAVVVDVAAGTCSPEHHTNRIGDVAADRLVQAGTDGLVVTCRVAPVDVRVYHASGTITHGGAAPLSLAFEGTFQSDQTSAAGISVKLTSGLLPEMNQPACTATLDPTIPQGVGAGRLFTTITCNASCPITVEVRLEDCVAR